MSAFFIFGEDARFRWLMARERILGIPFFTGSVDEAVAETWCGGLVVAPLGPNLANRKSQDDEVLRFAMAGRRTGGGRREVDFGWS